MLVVTAAQAWQWLALLLFAPITEEWIFRGFVHEYLLAKARLAPRGTSPWSLANLLTALIFALAHVPLRGWALALAVLVPALALGSLYERKRRVWPCILMHALMNLMWLIGSPWLPAWAVG